MTTTYGLTEEGLLVPSLTEVRERMSARLQNTLGQSIDTGDKSIIGQITGIFAAAVAQVWEKLEAVHSSQDADKATGAALDAVCSLTGTLRRPPTYSTVTLTLTGSPLVLVTANNQAQTESTEKTFATTADATIIAVPAWATSTLYDIGDRVTNAGSVYQCIDDGTSAGSGPGPNTFDADITDNTAHWAYLGEGTGAVDVIARATETGAITGTARDINRVFTSVGGWDGVINVLDATLGNDRMADGQLRLLRLQELATGGSTPINALLAELQRVEGVIDRTVYIFANNTDVTNGDGVPPHTVEALVHIAEGDEEDQRVFDALLAGVAAGIRTYGTVTGTAVDDTGTEHEVRFSRPTEIPIYLDLEVVADPTLFPEDGADQIKQAIVAWGDLQAVGKNAVAGGAAAQAFTITGVLDVPQCFIDDAPSPATSTTIAINRRQLAVYDTSRIAVTVTFEEP